jgi:hypothetical protein
MCPVIDSLSQPNDKGMPQINHSSKVKLVYMQGFKTLGQKDLVDYSHERNIRRHFADQWVSSRPPTCNCILLVFADNLEVVLWQHQDYSQDRRRH